jgi:hypothetical protein
VRLTLRHTYDFGADGARVGRSLVTAEGWDAARDLRGPFGLPEDRAAWEALAASAPLRARAADVARVAERVGAGSLCSYGVGTGALELALARAAPDLRLTCTDFAPRTVARLARLFHEATVVAHDLVRDPPLAAELHVLHRVDTELSSAEWRAVFPRFGAPVLLVPVLLLGWREAAKTLVRRARHPRAARAGYLRSEDALRALWAASHEDERVTVGGAPAFLLTPRS